MQTHYTFDPLRFRLTRTKRVMIMLFLIGTFFIVSPILIFYTMGFRYDLKSGIVRTTGVISVNIEPKDARVYIQEKPIQEKMPARLSNLTPGAYRMRIEKQGYKTWEKEINVVSNQTTYIHSFELLKDATPAEATIPKSIIELHSLPVTESIVGLAEVPQAVSSTYDVFAFDPKKQSFEPIQSFSNRPEISVSPFHANGMILEKKAKGLGQTTVHLFDTKNYDRRSDLSFPSAAQFSYQWSKTSGEIYTQINDKIERFDIQGKRAPVGVVSSSIEAWYVEYPETLWVIKKATLYVEQKPAIAYSVPEDTENILDINRDRIILKTKNGATVIKRNEKNNAVTNIFARSWYYHDETEEWWVWSDWELSTIHKDGNLQLLSREGKKIKGAVYLNSKGLKLLAHDHGADAFNPGIFPTQTLLDRTDIDEIFAIPKYKTLYFTIAENGAKKLFKLPY